MTKKYKYKDLDADFREWIDWEVKYGRKRENSVENFNKYQEARARGDTVEINDMGEFGSGAGYGIEIHRRGKGYWATSNPDPNAPSEGGMDGCLDSFFGMFSGCLIQAAVPVILLLLGALLIVVS